MTSVRVYCVVLLSFCIRRGKTLKIVGDSQPFEMSSFSFPVLLWLQCILLYCGLQVFELCFLLWILSTVLFRLRHFYCSIPKFTDVSFFSCCCWVYLFKSSSYWFKSHAFHLVLLSASTVFLLTLSVPLIEPFYPFFPKLVPDYSLKRFLLLSKSMYPHSQCRSGTMAWAKLYRESVCSASFLYVVSIRTQHSVSMRRPP